ncbi:uncharacterized protein Z520_00451 [Fonsecaea multimorphosa CBS 102226]|uniref:DUF7704 domain-containing protein n=1 Tax=Fonsecaea multimorphosa CBS 102226 TaxID=1442371 RepID=A0A0D2KJV8_9EURO|nr:uncharacterized protein Z520_00451 [Fonsecaea multimorphosa CBS 102226]KIY03760.1 hypothetical protein Z520_00451 [Fonsecaea multimorphosa CBS 102226]OAL32453.1 hypothetical protein AYO22_00475 [Fonsecaea multimorphosa]
MSSSPEPIPAFYRVFFSTIDPVIALSGVLTQLFSPATILRLYNASSSLTLPPAIETTVLLDSSAGYLLSTLFLQVVMLRLRPADRTVWKCLEASILIQDVALVAAVARSLDAQHRLAWRMVTGEEWGNLGILVGVGVLRAAFLMGIGMEGGREARKNLKRA